MVNKRERELTDTIEPTRVRNPMYVEVLADINVGTKSCRCLVQLIEYNAVINAADAGFALRHRMIIIKFFPFLYQFSKAYRLDAEVVAGAIEVDAGFLLMGADLQQDHFFRRAVGDDRLLQQIEVRGSVNFAEVLAIVLRNVEVAAELFRVKDLEAIKTGEPLHFDQLWLISALAILTDTEIKSDEMRVGALVRYPIGRRNGAISQFAKSRLEDDIDEMFADIGEFGKEILWDEDRCLGDTEFNSTGVGGVEVG